MGCRRLGVSQKVISILGGASQQAVAQARDPREWLDRRVGEACSGEGDVGYLLREVSKVLRALPEGKPGGRPVERSPEGLAGFLGVEWQEGDDLARVFARYLKAR